MSDDFKVLCLLDVLGFKSLFESMGLKRIEDRYEKLIAYVKEQTGGLDIVPTSDGHVAVGWLLLGNTYFSDTMLFWMNYNKMALPTFTQIVSETICYGIENQFPLRGTLSVGHSILEKESGKYLGEPIIEATETEKFQKWIGVSFGRSFSKPGFNEGFYLSTVLPYKSHYKEDVKEHEKDYCTGMVVDWPRRWRETRKEDVRPLVNALDTDPDFSDYYKRTLRFIDFSEKNHDWFTKEGHLDYG